jgi:hypothetical protein
MVSGGNHFSEERQALTPRDIAPIRCADAIARASFCVLRVLSKRPLAMDFEIPDGYRNNSYGNKPTYLSAGHRTKASSIRRCSYERNKHRGRGLFCGSTVWASFAFSQLIIGLSKPTRYINHTWRSLTQCRAAQLHCLRRKLPWATSSDGQHCAEEPVGRRRPEKDESGGR